MLRGLVAGAIVIVLIFSFFLVGCVDEEEFTKARFECIDLTSQAFARIPECDSQQECFEELEKKRFNFSVEELPFGVKQELFEYKNRVARSWVYYNRALERVNEIRGICLNAKGFDRLIPLANELNHFLLMAFEESDKANEHSLRVLAMEAVNLKMEEVERMREEQLFDVFVKINNNLNALSTPNQYNKDSYYGRFLKKVKEFNSLSEKTGFSSIILKQFGFEDLFFPLSKISGKKTVSNYEKKVFFLPFLGQAFSSFVSFMEGSHDLQQSLEAIRVSPAFEFLNIYSDLLGERDSVLEEFSDLIKEDSLSRTFLNKEHTQLKKRISEKISSAREKMNRIPFNEFSYLDENFFFSLYSLLTEETPFSYRKFEFESIREGWQKSSLKLESIEFDFHSLKSKQFTNQISLGESTAQLKKLNASLDELIESLDYIELELLGGIVEKCRERIPLLESKLTELKNSSPNQNPLISTQTIEERIDSFKKANSLNEKIHYCYSSLQGFEEFSLALKNREERERKTKKKLSECLDSLDLFLPVLRDSNPELTESIEQFKKELAFDNLDSGFACNSLLSRAENSVRKELNARGLEEKFTLSTELLEKLRFLLKKAPAFKEDSSIDSLETEHSKLSTFFNRGEINLVKAIDQIHSIKWRANKLSRGLSEEIESFLAEYISNRVKTTSFPVSNVVLGEEFEDKKRIEFTNPFFSWNESIAVSIPFSHSFDGIKSKSPNINEFRVTESKATVQFSSIPEGSFFVDVFSTAIVSFSTEERLLRVNSELAEIEKIIKFNSPCPVNGLKATVSLNSNDLNIARVRAFNGFNQVPVFLKNKKAVFSLNQVESSKEFYLYYVLIKPVLLKKTTLNTSEIDENRFEQRLSLTALNRLSFKVRDFKACFPFPFEEESIERMELFDSKGNEVEHLFALDKVCVEIDSLSPGQRKEFFAEIRVLDKKKFTQELLNKTKQKLFQLSNSQNQSIKSQSETLLSELEKIGEIGFIENRQKITKIFEKTSNLEKTNSLESELNNEFLFQERELEKKINSLKEEKKLSDSLNFNEYSQALSNLLNECENSLSKAEEFSATNKQKALELLNQALLKAKEFNGLDFSTELSALASASFEKISDSFTEWVSLGFNSQQIVSQKNKAHRLLEDFNKFGERAELKKAKQKADELVNLSQQTALLLEKEIDTKANQIVEKINEFLEIQFSAREKLEKLKKQRESITDSELVKAKIVLPFTLKEIERLEKELQKNQSKHQPLFNEVLELSESGENREIIQKTKGIDFSELIEEISTKNNSLKTINQSIKEKALSTLSRARQNLNSLNEDGILALDESVNQARKNNYLKSLVLSKTALASLKQPEQLDWSMFLFPILILLIFLFFRALKKNRKKIKPFYRRVPRQY